MNLTKLRMTAVAAVLTSLAAIGLAAVPAQADTTVAAPTIKLMPSGPSSNWTDRAWPDFQGTRPAGSAFQLTIDGKQDGFVGKWATTANSDSTATSWHWYYGRTAGTASSWWNDGGNSAVSPALADGQHTATITVKTVDGTTSTTWTFWVDTIPTNAPTMLSPADNSYTNNTTPTLVERTYPNGPAGEPKDVADFWFWKDDYSVEVFSPFTTSPIFGIQTDANNQASYLVLPQYADTQLETIPDGVYHWRADAVDAGGNAASGPTYTLTIDTIAPPAPTIDTPTDATRVSALTGTLPVDPQLVAPDDKVQVLIDGKPYQGSVNTDSSTWTVALTSALAPGAHTVTAKGGDEAGNWSDPASITVAVPVPFQATKDTARLAANQAATIDVLANDSSPDGMTLLSVTGNDGAWTATNGKVTYRPRTDFAGTATGSYVIRANDGQTRSAAIAVTVLPKLTPTITTRIAKKVHAARRYRWDVAARTGSTPQPGTWTLRIDGVRRATKTGSDATFRGRLAHPGRHTITITYSGNTATSGRTVTKTITAVR